MSNEPLNASEPKTTTDVLEFALASLEKLWLQGDACAMIANPAIDAIRKELDSPRSAFRKRVREHLDLVRAAHAPKEDVLTYMTTHKKGYDLGLADGIKRAQQDTAPPLFVNLEWIGEQVRVHVFHRREDKTSLNVHSSTHEVPPHRADAQSPYANMYCALADAMGYTSGKDGMAFSPEEWANALLQDATSYRAALVASEPKDVLEVDTPASSEQKMPIGEVAWMVANLKMKEKEAARRSALPPGVCPECDGEGEQGGQFCGGYWKCEACAGTGKATGAPPTATQ